MRTPKILWRAAGVLAGIGLLSLLDLAFSDNGRGQWSGERSQNGTNNSWAERRQLPDTAAHPGPSGRPKKATSSYDPEKERMHTRQAFVSLRGELHNELDLVRDRLKNGDQRWVGHEADRRKAADLAQQIQRVDLAIASVDASNAKTWRAIRVRRLGDVEELRSWVGAQARDSATASNEAP